MPRLHLRRLLTRCSLARCALLPVLALVLAAGMLASPVLAAGAAPTVSDILDQTTNEDSATGAISFTVADADSDVNTVTLSGSSSNPALVPDASIVFGGSGANRTVTITPAADQNGSATITVTASDGANTGSDTFVLTVNAVNDAPVNSGPILPFINAANITIPDSGAATPYPSTITVAGVSASINNLTVTLTNINHTWPDDLDILLVGPTGQSVLLMSDAGGSADLVNQTLTFDDAATAVLPDGSGITSGSYQPTNYGSGDTFPAPAPAGPYGSALAVFDGSNPNGDWKLYVFDNAGGDQGNIAGGWTLNINAGVTTNEDMAVALSAANALVSVSDVDAGSNPVLVTLATGDGTLTLNGTAGLSGSGSGTGSLSYSGTLTDLNTALDGLIFTPAADFNGAASFQMTSDDQGATGGPAQTDSDTYFITVTPVDDPPVLTGSGSAASYTENAAGVAVDPNITLADSDGPNLDGARISISGGFASGQDMLEFTNQNGISGSYNATTGVLTLSGNASAADYEAALRDVRYRNTSDDPDTAPRAITFAAGQNSFYFAGNGHFYRYVAAPSLSWTAARAAANNSSYYGLQGYLVTVTSSEESDFTLGQLGGAIGWLGANDAAVEGEWRWVTGPEGLANSGAGTQFWQGAVSGTPTPAGSYANWNTGEPNDFNGVEDYGQFIGNGTWNDLPESSSQGYVIEYGGMPGDPTLSLIATATVNITAVNDAPTVSNIADQTTDEDTATGAISFTVADVDNNVNSLTITGSSSDPVLVPDANIVVSGSGANRTVTITPAADQNGSATITITVSDGTDTGSTAFVLTVNAINDTPTATFGGGGSVNEGASATVSFSNQADADPADVAAGLHYSYDFDNDGTWDSGDGTYAGGVTSSTAAVPAALLADGPSAFTTRAWISDQSDAHTEYTTAFTVANLAPLANAGGPYSGVAGSTIALSAAASTDAGTDTLTYTWDLDNDGQFGDATGVSATFNATINGVFTVTVQVTDSDGASATDTASVTVGNVAPIVDAGAGMTLAEGDTFTSTGIFSDTGSSTWTATVDYGDGSGAQPLALAANKRFSLSHVYTDNGNYTVLVRVSDEQATGQDSLSVQVTSVAPTASFSATSAVNEGGSASVSFSGAADPSSVDTAAGFRYSYDFDNDGTFEITDSLSNTATVPAALLADGPLTLTVRGRISDKDGSFTEYTAAITVANVAPTVDAGGPYSGATNQLVALQASATDPGSDTLSYAWDLDDDGQFNDATGANATFSASTNGTYTVRVRVTDDDGASATATAIVTIAQFQMFMPMIISAAEPPDLVVESIMTANGALTVVIRNQGGTAVTRPFWVDTYINPTTAPSGVNQIWSAVGSRGLAWGVQNAAIPLAPGASLTLTVEDAFYFASKSQPGGPLAVGDIVYVQVDSAAVGSPYGAVREADELDGATYNNIRSITVTEAVKLPAATVLEAASATALPARPQ